MKVRVLFFAGLRERLQCAEAIVTLNDIATVADVWESLCRDHPLLQELAGCVSFAVNREYASLDHRLATGDTVALLPPVSGG